MEARLKKRSILGMISRMKQTGETSCAKNSQHHVIISGHLPLFFFILVVMSWRRCTHNIIRDLCGSQPRKQHLHVSQHDVVTGDPGEVGFQNGERAGQSHMAAPAEKGDAREAEDCSHQRCVRHPP